MSARRQIGAFSIPEARLPAALLAREAVERARALAHYTAMAREATHRPLRCVTCGGPAFDCKCVSTHGAGNPRPAGGWSPCAGCRYPGDCQRVGCASSATGLGVRYGS